MDLENHPYNLIATASAGLEKVVARELEQLDYAPTITGTGRIAFTGDASAIATANLWLRSADRVLLEVGRFPATDFDQLYHGTQSLPWFEFIPQDAWFPVNGRSHKSQLSSVPAVQRTVKKAVVEALQAEYGDAAGSLPDDRDQGPHCIIEIAMRDDEAVLTLDTSGVGLHQRGYRELTGKAPMRETMAAALVMLSHWNPQRALMDPFCGTGTILIEAAMIGRNMAPGLQRTFDCEDWPCMDAAAFTRARAEARDAIKPALPIHLFGTDIDTQALSYARHHARKAGVADDIYFEERAFEDLTSKRKHGCIITNPPWGQRLGEEQEARELHRQMPIVLSRLETWSHFIITPYPEFENLIGQKANRRRKLYNAQVAATYYQFWGPPPEVLAPMPREDPSSGQTPSEAGRADDGHSVPSGDVEPVSEPKRYKETKPVFGGLDTHAEVQAEAFANRLVKNARHFRKWPARGIHCYRLYERDIPEIPLVVDRYHDCLHIAEYERPNDRSLAQQVQWLERMCKAAAEALEIEPGRTFLKTRHKQRGHSQHERQGDEAFEFVAEENGLKFLVNLSDYIDTGLFLDHRNARQMVRERAEGKRVLNLFAYTGAFSVYAAAGMSSGGGAASTMTVDLSNTYLRWAQENFELNGLDPYGEQHLFYREDVMSFVDHHERVPGGSYDLAIIDPPTFSNSKRVESVFDVQDDHVLLLNGVAKLMSSGGLIYFSNNNRRFKLEEDRLNGFKSIHEISKQTVPEDFRNKRIHRCWAMRV